MSSRLLGSEACCGPGPRLRERETFARLRSEPCLVGGLLRLEGHDLGLHGREQPFAFVEHRADVLARAITLRERNLAPSFDCRSRRRRSRVTVARGFRLHGELMISRRNSLCGLEAVEEVGHARAAEKDAQRGRLIGALVELTHSAREACDGDATLLLCDAAAAAGPPRASAS